MPKTKTVRHATRTQRANLATRKTKQEPKSITTQIYYDAGAPVCLLIFKNGQFAKLIDLAKL